MSYYDTPDFEPTICIYCDPQDAEDCNSDHVCEGCKAEIKADIKYDEMQGK